MERAQGVSHFMRDQVGLSHTVRRVGDIIDAVTEGRAAARRSNVGASDDAGPVVGAF